jgi:ribonucleotide reductase beta subunit family protein with ferritin-like domain
VSTTQTERSTPAEQLSYTDLYRRWEDGNWSAMGYDFARDREGWAALSEMQRASARWLYSMFFYGENSVADNLSPYIDAAPREEQKYFLATQQVDEARHAVFFHRFFTDVIGAGDTIAATLASTRTQHNWGYTRVFDRLDRMADELRRDRSLPKFAQAIAMYHMVVEAALAQPGQHYIEDYFASSGTMPAFTEGMHNVARDEQRHIGFGVKVLSELFRASDECKAAVVELLREVLMYSIAVFVPPGWNREYTRAYGFEIEDVYAFAIRSIRMKWRATGYPIEEMPPDVFPYDPALPEDEVARRLIAMMEAGVAGEPGGRPDASEQSQRLLFDVVAQGLSRADGPLTIQWRFSDAAPWHVEVANGATRAEPGEAATKPDVTLESSWADWVGLSVHGRRPARAILRRQLRLHGSPRALLRLQRALPTRPSLV